MGQTVYTTFDRLFAWGRYFLALQYCTQVDSSITTYLEAWCFSTLDHMIRLASDFATIHVIKF